MGKIIALSGSHGTGKTTAAHARVVKEKVSNPGLRVGFLGEVARTCPYPINLEGSAVGQFWIFGRHLSQELGLSADHDLVVADRCLLDVVAYTFVLGFSEAASRMSALYGEYLKSERPYSEIRIMPPRTSFLVEDGQRSTDAGFQAEVHEALLSLHRMWGGPVVWP